MKKYFLLLFLPLLFFSPGMIAQGVSHATIYSADNYKFTVFLNGEQKNEKPLANVRIINLPQLYYKLKIVFVDSSLVPIEKKIWNLQDANGHHVDATFEITLNKKGEPTINWRSQTISPSYIQTQPTVVIQNAPATTTVQQTTTTSTETDNSDKVSLYIPIGDITISTGNTSTPSSQTTTTTTTTTSASPAASTTSTNCSGTLLNEKDFNDAVNSIGSRTAEDSKLLMAKQIINGSCMSSIQVKQILELLNTESARLDLAKFAYSHTIDKGNYYKVNEVFKDEKSVDELNQFILK